MHGYDLRQLIGLRVGIRWMAAITKRMFEETQMVGRPGIEPTPCPKILIRIEAHQGVARRVIKGKACFI
jgi:hypothetical protein